MAILRFRLDTDGTLERLQRQMADWPAGVERARKRALRKLGTWINRQVLREVARENNVAQKVIKDLKRYRATVSATGITVWIGTNPVKAHHLGKVLWTPRMQGARVGRRSFPDTWSWSEAARTKGLVMRRTSRDRLPIEVVRVPIHDQTAAAVNRLMPDINQRFETLMRQELNYALNIEAARA